ncbi:hypothetical protein QUF51_02145 [Bacillus pumilus]|nr:hypothetical protein [Bacillus pumilus]OLP65594.1 hypothetical protein BACPU_12120 [Bacillus pumilus]
MLWIFTQDEQSLVHVNEVTVKGKKLEGIIGRDSLDWTKTLGKYDSQGRAAEILQDIVKAIEASEGATITYKMPDQ